MVCRLSCGSQEASGASNSWLRSVVIAISTSWITQQPSPSTFAPTVGSSQARASPGILTQKQDSKGLTTPLSIKQYNHYYSVFSLEIMNTSVSHKTWCPPDVRLSQSALCLSHYQVSTGEYGAINNTGPKRVRLYLNNTAAPIFLSLTSLILYFSLYGAPYTARMNAQRLHT